MAKRGNGEVYMVEQSMVRRQVWIERAAQGR